MNEAVQRLNALRRWLVPRLSRDPDETRPERIFRRIRIGIVVLACLVTLQSVLLVLGAWRNDRQFLMIVMGARTRALSFLDAKKLLQFGFVEAGIDPPPEPSQRMPKKPVRARRTTLAQ